MYPELTATKLVACLVGAVVLLLASEFRNQRWQRKQQDESRVNEELRAGTPLHEIEETLDQEENR